MQNKYRKPHSYKRKKSFLRNRIFWLGLLAVVLLFTAFYFLYFSSFFQIKNIEVKREIVTVSPGIKMVSDEDVLKIKEMADRAANRKILFAETRSIFLFNSRKVRQDISVAILQLESVEIEKKFFNKTLNISVSRKEGVVILRVGEEFLLIDKNGEVFGEADDYDKEGLAILTKQDYILDSGAVFGSTELQQILMIKTKLENLGINIKEFLVFSEDKLIVKTNESWEAYFNIQGDIDWQVVKLNAVLDEKIPEDKRGDLEYIELRFGNLAPFKYKGN